MTGTAKRPSVSGAGRRTIRHPIRRTGIPPQEPTRRKPQKNPCTRARKNLQKKSRTPDKGPRYIPHGAPTSQPAAVLSQSFPRYDRELARELYVAGFRPDGYQSRARFRGGQGERRPVDCGE